LAKVTFLGTLLRMATVTLAAVVLVGVVVNPKEMVPEEEEVLGDRTILLLAKLMLFLIFVIFLSRT
jgi:hypothetical protein|tara:strand:+ start:231 stop:428 length:198 start_codon:yes stop_codon:yes gene_type:complete